MKLRNKIIIVSLSAVVLTSTLLFFTGVISLRSFPEELTSSKKITLNCEYQNKKLVIEETLYGNVDRYYSSEPKKNSYDRSQDYGRFVFSYPQDETIKKITEKISSMASEMNLSADRTLDLATCFVQNIPYDTEKASRVLAKNPGDIILSTERKYLMDRFPYETLYDNLGICTDKTYLENAIAAELGYGTSIFTFDTERHMAAAIEVPVEYSYFGTGFAYIETTNTGYKVGQLPVIDKKVGGAVSAELDKLTADELIKPFQESNFSEPTKTVKVSTGKKYERIIEIAKTQERLKEIVPDLNGKNKELRLIYDDLVNSRAQMDQAKDTLETYEKALEKAKNVYNSNPTEKNYDEYTKVYDQYLYQFNISKKFLDAYNSYVEKYNSSIKNFNILVEEYNRLIKED